jgi:hypothetical protein
MIDNQLFMKRNVLFLFLFFQQVLVAQQSLQSIGIPVVSRKAWGCPEPYEALFWRTTETDMTHIVIHHSAGNDTMSDWRRELRSIWRFHTIQRRWNDIGYNYLIDPNGVVYEGRAGGDYARAAHMCRMNENKFGICLLGDYDKKRPSRRAIEMLIKVVAWKCVKDSINPQVILPTQSRRGILQCVAGHRDGCGRDYTDCPGDSLYSLLNFIRQRADDYCGFLEQKRFENPKIETIMDTDRSFVTVKPELPLMIRFYNALGKVVLQSVDNPVNIENLEAGIYYIRVGQQKIRFVKMRTS